MDYKDINRHFERAKRFEVFVGPLAKSLPRLLTGKDEQGNVVDLPRVPLSVASIQARRYELRDELPLVEGGVARSKEYWTRTSFLSADFSFNAGPYLVFVLGSYGDGVLTPLGRKVLDWFVSDPVSRGIYGVDLDSTRYDLLMSSKPEEGVFKVERRLATMCDNHADATIAMRHTGLCFLDRNPDFVPEVFSVPGLHGAVTPCLFKLLGKDLAGSQIPGVGFSYSPFKSLIPFYAGGLVHPSRFAVAEDTLVRHNDRELVGTLSPEGIGRAGAFRA